ncbi:FAD-binding oxidoreductase [Flavobacteriaceae bacterium XHP0103]|uniref:NAD(P)/FAD-dependent oxidoreductase n=1 Tax=Marixanthotalea marina TaxID=2844359 RepID=UPI002989D991|nr:FAD-dependent oxidoreductase [Marixanthotalea marina]MBU3821244.1 FAD-binding oxidoreductase [Marixanthotalea marina]
MEIDYIVVGCGLAGIAFCEQLRTHNKSFVVFDDSSQRSSTVAGGLYNPVVLKRFTSVWKSKEQLEKALPLYNKLAKQFGVQLDYKIPVYRKFASLEEQNDWFAASDKPNLSEYLSSKIVKNTNKNINAPFGFGEVLGTGRIDVNTLVESYKNYLSKKNILLKESFNYSAIESTDQGVSCKGIKASQIVFSEGFGVNKNTFFKDLPLVPAKGELLIIEAPDLNMDFVLKGNGFLIPIGNHQYIVGATYNWNDTTHQLTDKAKEELLDKLKNLITCKFKVVGQVAGIRPTVKDRRPLVGQHHQHKNLYVLNGLGTRGVMIGPYVAEQLFDFIEHKKPLEKEIDIKRFGI